MQIAIGGLIDPATLARLRGVLRHAPFIDGKATAGALARRVKHNEQLASDSAAYADVARTLEAALGAHPVLQAAAWPRRFSPVLVSRYRVGASYGPHVDNALLGDPPLRSDLAFTLFISEPADYDGGELVLQQPEGDATIKLDAGTLYLYPATTVHRVDPVTRGERLVVVGWIQSLVRDPRVRELLFDLVRARELAGPDADPELVALLARTQSNLLRLHAEP